MTASTAASSQGWTSPQSRRIPNGTADESTHTKMTRTKGRNANKRFSHICFIIILHFFNVTTLNYYIIYSIISSRKQSGSIWIPKPYASCKLFIYKRDFTPTFGGNSSTKLIFCASSFFTPIFSQLIVFSNPA